MDLLRIDFEQAYSVHSQYQNAQYAQFNLLLKVIALPVVIVATLITAKVLSETPDVDVILGLEVVWWSMLASGSISLILLRSYIVLDMVQTEAKHQVNSFRKLYLELLEDSTAKDWHPYWGEKIEYLERPIRMRAVTLSSVTLGALNAAYIAYGLFRICAQKWPDLDGSLPFISWALGVVIWSFQQQFFIEAIHRNFKKWSRSRSTVTKAGS